MTQHKELPVFPAPQRLGDIRGYTDHQLKAYGQQCAAHARAELELYKAALREHIRLYQVDDQDYSPESRADKIMAMAIERMRAKP